MTEKIPLLRLVQPTAKQSITDDDSGAAAPERSTPDAHTMASMIEEQRKWAIQYGQVPSNEVTKQRLINKYQQDPAQRGGELGATAQIEPHPILSDYLRGMDDSNVTPSLTEMTPDELEKLENEKQYRNQMRLQRVNNLNSAPILTR